MKNGQRLKVGLVFDDTLDSSDGVAQYVKTLGAWLSDQGHEVSYLVGETKLTSWNDGTVHSLAKNIKVRFNGNKLSVPLPARRRRIKRLMADEEFDVLHVMVPYSPFMAAKVIKSASPDTVIIGTFHIFPSGWLSVFGSKLLYTMLRPSLKRFAQIVSVSSAAAGFAGSSYRIKTEIVPNAVDTKRFKVSPMPNGPTKRIVFLGRLVDRKGADQLIRAFASLLSRYDKVELVIAGDGPKRPALENQTQRLGISDKVRFLGYIDERDKPGLLASADIACFPSLYGESFGIVLIEAMAAGSRIVLAGDNPGYRSVLGDQALLLVNPRKTELFADRLNELLTDDTAIAKLHKWQRDNIDQYDIGTVGRRITDIYNGQIARQLKKSNNKLHG
jgi:phosphatidyl-myo-inositol alpha-mannosyltransferase